VHGLLTAHEQVAHDGGDGAALADRLGVVLSGSASTVDLVAFGPSGAALAVVVYGHAFADVSTANGEQRLALRQARDGVRSVLPGQLISVRAGLGDVSQAEAQRFGSLDHGVVQASGLVLMMDAAAADAPAAAPVSAPEPAAAMPNLVKAEPVEAPAVVAAPPVELPVTEEVPPPPVEPVVAEAPAYVEAAPVAEAPPAEAPAMPVEAEMPLIMAAPDAPAEQALLAPPPSDGMPSVDRDQPFAAVSLLAPPPEEVEERAPLPVAEALAPAAPDVAPAPHAAADDSVQVLGVYCKNGHFDDPSARYCAICGISMAQQTLVPRMGPRPPLGVLVLDDGSVFSLDRDYVIGRDPARDADVSSGAARPLRVEDPHGQLSRVHARIHLEGWQVEVVDLGSANGTGVWRPGDTAWTRVPPQTRIPIRPGTQVGFGRNQLRYESHTNV